MGNLSSKEIDNDKASIHCSGNFDCRIPACTFNQHNTSKRVSFENPVDALKPIRDFVHKTIKQRYSVSKAISWMIEHWDKKMEAKTGEKKKVRDHGLLGAARLLNVVQVSQVTEDMKVVLYHAALAIAIHNLADWQRVWPWDFEVKLPVGVFPVCNLLAFCDVFQAWDRESGVDPAHFYQAEGLTERLILSKNAYIQGSSVTGFTVSAPTASNRNYRVSASIRFFLKSGENATAVCQGLRDKIESWKGSGAAKSLREAFCLSDLIEAHLQYWIPNIDEPIELVI